MMIKYIPLLIIACMTSGRPARRCVTCHKCAAAPGPPPPAKPPPASLDINVFFVELPGRVPVPFPHQLKNGIRRSGDRRVFGFARGLSVSGSGRCEDEQAERRAQTFHSSPLSCANGARTVLAENTTLDVKMKPLPSATKEEFQSHRTWMVLRNVG